MGRGRQGTRSGSGARARTREADPAQEVAAVLSDVELRVDVLVHERVDELLDPARVQNSWDSRYQGGVAGDTSQPALDLVEAAEHALAGDDAERRRAREILGRAREHQLAYLDRLEQAVAEPRRRASLDMWRPAGAKTTETTKHAALLNRARDLLERIDTAIADPENLSAAQSGRVRVREQHGLVKLQRAGVGKLVCAALVTDEVGRARALLRAYWTTVPDRDALAASVEEIDDAGLLLAARLCRAELAVGNDRPGDWVAEPVRVSEQRLERLGAIRRSGDEAERELHRSAYGPSYQDLGAIKAPTDAAQIMALARAMARVPDRFRRTQRRALTDTPEPVVALNIRTTPEGLRDLVASHGASVHWEGMRLVDTDASARGGKRALSLCARIESQVGDQQIQVSVHTPLGTTALKREDRQLEWAAGRLEALGLEEVAAGARRETDRGDREFGQRPMITFPSRPNARTSRSRRLQDVLGADVCSHPNSTWVADGARGQAPDTARLECPDCHRTRVACVPLHRLGAAHPLAPAEEEPYLARQRYYAELAGDRRPVRSIAQLRERDGLAATDPGVYGSGGPARLHDAGYSLKRAFARERRPTATL